MGLLEDTFKFSTGGNYYGTGNNYYDDQEKKKNEWKTRFNARHGIGITKDQNWIDAKTGSRNDLMKFMAQKEKENYAIKQDALEKTRRDYSVSSTDSVKGRTSDGMDLSKWHGNNAQDQQSWWQKLAGKAGIDYKTAQATWKEKGGFEGLMANPAFTMGLAFMQAGAEGKTLGQGALDNVMKAAGISSHYKKIIEDRKQAPIQATAADIDEVKTMLDRVKLKEPNMWEKALGWVTGDNVTAKYDRAAEAVAVAYQQEIDSMQRAHKGTKPLIIDDTLKEKVLMKVLKDKRVKQKDGWAIFGPFTSGTIQKESTLPKFNAQGGPVAKGEVSIVGEQGPEYFLPKESGKILSNDDSRIFSMLLTANPQLQQVSRTRAEKILRNRFPEYFE